MQFWNLFDGLVLDCFSFIIAVDGPCSQFFLSYNLVVQLWNRNHQGIYLFNLILVFVVTHRFDKIPNHKKEMIRPCMCHQSVFQ